MHKYKRNHIDKLLKYSIWIILALLVIDTLYAYWYGIRFQAKETCIVYRFLPRWLFLINEHVIELFMQVTAGAFAGVLVGKYVARYRALFPKNQIAAFLYASVIPVCSCSAIPLIDSMKSKASLRTLMTFVIAAPLLNPYVIFLSFSVLGVNYALLRIAGAFFVSILAGSIVAWFHTLTGKPDIGVHHNCDNSSCSVAGETNCYRKTWKLITQILPYILLAGVTGLLFELTGPLEIIKSLPMQGSLYSLIIVTIIGVAVYVCNGADIVFLAPLLRHTDLGMGNAIAFSLTSNAICVSSIIILSRFLGRKLTGALVGSVFLLVIAFSLMIG